MIRIIFETLIFPILALCLTIALAIEQSLIWWIGALVILLWFLLDGPRMLIFLVEVLHKDAMLSSPHVSDCGFTVLNEKGALPLSGITTPGRNTGGARRLLRIRWSTLLTFSITRNPG